MDADIDIAAVGALLGDETRAAMLTALADGRALPATDLAHSARVSASTASAHLAKLTGGGLLVAERHGRHRYFRLADARVAEAIEVLAAIAPPREVKTLHEADAGAALRAARTCYDHLAGRLGVALFDAHVRRRFLRLSDAGAEVTRVGEREFARLGVDVEALRTTRRPLVRVCLDWSERRHHLAGGIGAALTARMLELEWLNRRSTGRALDVTPAGRDELRDRFGVVLEAGG